MPVTTDKLQKGQRVSITKDNPGMDELLAGLGWRKRLSIGKDFDLDVLVFMLKDGKVRTDADAIFYGSLQEMKSPHPSGDPDKFIVTSKCGAIVYHGDNRNGEGDGDDETVSITLSKIPSDINEIHFVVSIFEAEQRGQNFSAVGEAHVHLMDKKSGKDYWFDLIEGDDDEDDNRGLETSMIFSKLYRKGAEGEWRYATVGQGFSGDITSLLRHYGVDV